MSVPERWRFSFDNEDVSLRDLSWADAVQVYRDAEAGDLAGQADGGCVSLEFDRAHAAVLVMGRDGVILRPYLPSRPAAVQDLGPFFCGGCGIRVGDHAEYLSRFVDRTVGFRLFVAVLSGPGLPAELPDPHPGRAGLPGFEDLPLAVKWQPLPSGECKHAEPGVAADPALKAGRGS